MANIRVDDLPEDDAPSASDFTIVDALTMRKTSLADLVAAGRPLASQAEAESGTDAAKAMTPLTVKQAIDFLRPSGPTGLQLLLSSTSSEALSALEVGAAGEDVFLAATAADIRALLDLEPGTDVQAQSAILQSLADETLTAGDILYASAANTVANLPIGTEGQRLTVVSGVPDWVTIPDAVFTPETYGAVADGVTDDATAIQDAVDAAVANGGGIVRFKDNATYKVDTAITVSGDNVQIEGSATLDFSDLPIGTSLNQVRAFIFTGSIETAISVTANVVLNTTTLTVDDTSTLAAGDIILLQSDQEMVEGYGNAATKRGELLSILSVDSGTELTLAGATSFQYLAAENARIQKVNTIRPRIKDVSLICGGVGKAHTGVAFDYCRDIYSENVSVDGGEDTGIQTWYCYRGIITGGTIKNSTSPVDIPGASTGYGVVLYNATRDVYVDRVHFENCQRSVTGGNTLPSIYCATQNCSVNGGLNGLGTHEPCLWWTIRDNTIVGVSENGLQLRGQYTKVYRNRIIGAGVCGIRVRTFVTNPNGITGIELVDNDVFGSGSQGIWLDGDATNGRVNHVQIRGGSILNSGENNIFGRRCSDISIEDVRLDGVSITGVIDGNGVFFNGSTTSGDRCERIDLVNVRVKNQLRHAFLFRYADDIRLTTCQGFESPNHCARFTFCNRVTVNGGFYEATDTNFTYGIYYENTNLTSTVGAELKGNTALDGSHAIVCQGLSTNACLDHVINGNTMIDYKKAVLVTGTNANYSVVVGNNGRRCTDATKFDVSGASQSVANNLV